MTTIQAIFLGLLQGLTEFLPVSSSGHLIVFQNFFGIEEPMLTFNIFLHLGTLLAVLVVFAKDIWTLLRRPFCREVALLIIATIPVALAGIFFEDYVTGIFSSTLSVGIALIVTGAMMYISDRFYGHRSIKDLPFSNALIVGIFQGVAILPGISRSGSTIFASLFCGMERAQAARFSFLLSIIAILGASGKESIDLIKSTGGLHLEQFYFVGMAAAAISGFFAIKFFLNLLKKNNMKFFAFYCWIFAAITIVWSLVK